MQKLFMKFIVFDGISLRGDHPLAISKLNWTYAKMLRSIFSIRRKNAKQTSRSQWTCINQAVNMPIWPVCKVSA